MTGKERETIARALGRAIADAPIRGTSVELTDRDVENIRDQLVESFAAGALGELLQIDVERLDVLVDVARMT
jgi:hypothetical protein